MLLAIAFASAAAQNPEAPSGPASPSVQVPTPIRSHSISTKENCIRVQRQKIGSHIVGDECLTKEELEWEQYLADIRARQAITFEHF